MTIDSSDLSQQPEASTESNTDPFTALAQVTVELFDPLVSSTFLVNLNTALVSPSLEHHLETMDRSRSVELELVEVTRYPNVQNRVGAHGCEPFSLLFRGSHQQPVISALYTVSHPDLADLNLFLNPVQVSIESEPGEHPEGLFYESCFN